MERSMDNGEEKDSVDDEARGEEAHTCCGEGELENGSRLCDVICCHVFIL